jgi:hypothetical protein
MTIGSGPKRRSRASIAVTRHLLERLARASTSAQPAKAAGASAARHARPAAALAESFRTRSRDLSSFRCFVSPTRATPSMSPARPCLRAPLSLSRLMPSGSRRRRAEPFLTANHVPPPSDPRRVRWRARKRRSLPTCPACSTMSTTPAAALALSNLSPAAYMENRARPMVEPAALPLSGSKGPLHCSSGDWRKRRCSGAAARFLLFRQRAGRGKPRLVARHLTRPAPCGSWPRAGRT